MPLLTRERGAMCKAPLPTKPGVLSHQAPACRRLGRPNSMSPAVHAPVIFTSGFPQRNGRRCGSPGSAVRSPDRTACKPTSANCRHARSRRSAGSFRRVLRSERPRAGAMPEMSPRSGAPGSPGTAALTIVASSHTLPADDLRTESLAALVVRTEKHLDDHAIRKVLAQSVQCERILPAVGTHREDDFRLRLGGC